jgi:phospholipid/cholesterol/gamma-HCH transport system substrate-binding protein
MKSTLETRLGLFFALILLAALILLEFVGGLDFFRRGVTVRARFDSVQELQAGAPVKLGGVPVGSVEAIALEDGRVVVTLRVRRDAGVRTDSRATIRFAGLMGQNFVALSFGSAAAPAVTDGTELESAVIPDLAAVMEKLDTAVGSVSGITNIFGSENFQNLLGPFTDFLKDNSPRLTAILGNLQVVSGNIADGRGTIGKLVNDPAIFDSALVTITNLAASASRFDSLAADAELILADIRSLTGDLAAGKGTLGRLARDEALYQETIAAMQNLREILEKVNGGQGLAGKLVNDEGLYKSVKGTLQKVEKATDGLEDQGPISVLGTVAGSLF